MSACPAAAIETMRMTALLRSVDCEINGAVFTSYRNLFGGAATPLASALVVAMTVYVAIIGFQLLRGHGGLSMLTPRALLLGLVLTFATSWPAYQTMVSGLLERGPDEIAQALTGSRGSATLAFADRIDRLFGTLAHQASGGEPVPAATPDAAAPAPVAGSVTLPTSSMITPLLVWSSALILLAGTIGVLVTAKIVLGVLLAIGPVFIVLALFAATRPLFEGWLKTALLFALAPMLVTLCGSAALRFLDPVVAALVKEPPNGPPTGPVVALFIGALVYAALLLLAVGAAVGIGSSWRAQRSQDTPAPPIVLPAAAPLVMAINARNGRVDRIVADINRSSSGGATAEQTRVIRLPGAVTPGAASAHLRPGLGQRRLPRPTAARLPGQRGQDKRG
jgi:type IV secretion system protein VirB6